jgi:hypothetical protein
VSAVRLAAGELLTLEQPRGVEVMVEAGRLWITEESRSEDIWLEPGQRACLAGDGLAVIEAMNASRVCIGRC